jgi:hypothetical protein
MPLILDNASIKIGIAPDALTTDLVELACVATHIELTPDVSITTIDTFCGSTDYPGNVKRTLNATLVQSFDPDATEETLSAAVESGGPVPFELLGYRDRPVSATNPKFSGVVVPQPYSPINGDAGAESTIDLSWGLVGAPLKAVNGAALIYGGTKPRVTATIPATEPASAPA